MQPEHTQDQSSLSDWVKLPDFIAENPQFQMNQMRTLLLSRKANGLDSCTRKIGKWIYINIPSFLIWIESHQNR